MDLRAGAMYEVDGCIYAIPAVDVTEVYNDGFAKGKAAQKTEFDNEVFITEFVGNGGNEVVLENCPFEPEFITIRCYSGVDSYDGTGSSTNRLHFYAYDRSSVDVSAGIVVFYNETKQTTQTAAISRSAESQGVVVWDKDKNTLTIAKMPSTKEGGTKTYFCDGFTYKVLAVKSAG